MSVSNNYNLDALCRLDDRLHNYIYINEGTDVKKVVMPEETAKTTLKSAAKISESIEQISEQILIDKNDIEKEAKKIIKNYKCSYVIAPSIAGVAAVIYFIVMLIILVKMTDKMLSSCGRAGSLFLVLGVPVLITLTGFCCGDENINTSSKRDWAIRRLHSDFDSKLYNLDYQLGLTVSNQEERASQLLETKEWFSLLNDDAFCSLIYNMFIRLKEINKDDPKEISKNEKNSKLLPWATVGTRRDALLKFRYKDIMSPYPLEIWELIKDYV